MAQASPYLLQFFFEKEMSHMAASEHLNSAFLARCCRTTTSIQFWPGGSASEAALTQ